MVVAFYPLYGVILGFAGAAVHSLPALPWKVPAMLLFWAATAALAREDRWIGAPASPWSPAIVLVWFVWFVAGRDEILPPTLAAVASQTVSRAAAIGLAWTSRPARAGLELSQRLNTLKALIAIAQGLLAAAYCGPAAAVAIVAGVTLMLRAVRALAYRKRGGIDGPLLTAARFGAEAVTVAVVNYFT